MRTLKVSSVGYHPIEVTLQITGKSVKMDLQLKEEPNELKAVTISAGSFAAGDKTRGAVMSSWILPQLPLECRHHSRLKNITGTQQVGEQEGLLCAAEQVRKRNNSSMADW